MVFIVNYNEINTYPHAETPKNIINNSSEWESRTSTGYAKCLHVQLCERELSLLPWMGFTVPYQVQISCVYDWPELEKNVMVLLIGYLKSW